MYRAAVLSWGKGQTRILPDGNNGVNCAAGTHKSGGCNFREFVMNLNSQNAVTPWDLPDDIDLDYPEPHSAANELNRLGHQTNMLSTRKLTPNAPTHGAPTPSYEATWEYLTDMIRESKYQSDCIRYYSRLTS